MGYKRPGLTADIIVEKEGEIILVKRKIEPFKGSWCIPGGHLEYGQENLEEAAIREFKEETGLIISVQDLTLLNVYSDPDRDPRGHIVTVAYFTDIFEGELEAGDDAAETRWFPLSPIPELSFDHGKIIEDYISWRKK